MEKPRPQHNTSYMVFIPDEPELFLMVSDSYPIPPLGGQFLINFGLFATTPESMESVQRILKKGILTVKEKKQGVITLHHGPVPGIPSPDPETYMNDYYKFWFVNPESCPFESCPDPDMGTRKIVIRGEKKVGFEVPFLYPVPMPGGKFEINYSHVLDPKDLPYIRELTKKTELYSYRLSNGATELGLGPPPGIVPNFSQSKQNCLYACYWIRNPNFAPAGWLEKPFSLSWPEEDIHLEIRGSERIIRRGSGTQIDWQRFLTSGQWERLGSTFDDWEPFADEWLDTKTVVRKKKTYKIPPSH